MSTPRRARVTVAYATVKLNDPISGQPTVAGFYQGAVFPPEADPENVANLVRREYAEWLDSDDLQAVEKQEDDAEKAQQEAAEKRAEESEAAVDKAEAAADAKVAADADKATAEADVKPTARASKDEWVDWAVSRRAEDVSEEDARAEAEGMTKAELVAKYGG